MQAILQPFLSQKPAAKLIRRTARQQWRLIGLNLASSLVEAVSEGGTMAIVFFAVKVLSAPESSPITFSNQTFLARWPELVTLMNGLSGSQLFLILLALAVLLQALQSYTKFLNNLSTSYFSARCRAIVTARIHSQLLSLKYACASSYKVGDLTDHAFWGPESIRNQIEQYSNMLVGGMLCFTYLVVLTKISSWLLVLVAVIGFLITLLQRRLLPKIREKAQGVTTEQVSISSRITENFQGLRLLHSSGQLDVADQQLQEGMSKLETQLRGQGRIMAIIGPFTSFLPILAIALLAALSLLFLGGNSSNILPSLVTFVFALQKLNSRISMINANLNQLAENRGRLNRLNEILSPEGKQFRRLGGITFKKLEQAIHFENVSLQYEQGLEPALNNISFTLPKGQMLALVGPSGAGKSSIADLLIGLYAPTAGQILVDDTPLEHLDLGSWQSRLGVVSQDTFLFNATIAENIAFGTPGSTTSQIQEACIAAQALEFIQSMPDGLITLVGERGYRLSGGQRQRLSLARAILREPELLVLDEATSALDSQSERLVQEALERFEDNQTVLVIAHRLSTIVRANQILVFESGRIVEQGTHESLILKAGCYSRLWSLQN